MVPPPPTGPSVYDRVIPASLSWNATLGTPMPLIQHLKDGFDAVKPPAWHRNEERAARGLFPVHNPATQLEGWERELVWMEILLLTGNPQASFRHLARGWGRDKGFQMVLAQFICERHGDVQRKKRDQFNTSRNGGGVANISANVWDDACYGDTAYNEALAADLLDFSLPMPPPCSNMNNNNNNEREPCCDDTRRGKHQQEPDQRDNARVGMTVPNSLCNDAAMSELTPNAEARGNDQTARAV